MQVFDVVVLLLLALSVGLGYWTGFVWQIIRIAAIIACFYGALLYHPVASGALEPYLPEAGLSLISFGLLFFIGLSACYVVTHLFHDVVDALKPQTPDRVLGALFGLAKGVLLLGILTLAIVAYGGDESDWQTRVAGSHSARVLIPCARAFLYALPGDVEDSMGLEQA